MSYDRGGREPTLTDANLLAGYLGSNLIGGQMTLHPDRARTGLARLFDGLGLAFERGLEGVQRVVISNMVRAAAVAFARRGLDPRDFTLLAYGGAGPMHAVEVARELGIAEVVIPPLPGAFSASGILLSDLRLDYGRSILRPLGDSRGPLERAFAKLEERARGELATQSVTEKPLLVRSVDLRYVGQSYEINVPYGEDLAPGFHRDHEARFGFASPGEAIEVVSVRLSAVVGRDRPSLQPSDEGTGPEGSREVLLAGHWTRTPVLSGRGPPGRTHEGPLIMEEETATTVIPPEATVRVDEGGNLHIEVG